MSYLAMKEEHEKEIPTEIWALMERREDRELHPYNTSRNKSDFDGITMHKDKFLVRYIIGQ